MTYRVHGLSLDSELPFPELPTTAGLADVRLKREALPAERPPEVTAPDYYLFEPDAVFIVWSGIGRVCVRGGEQIAVDPEPDAPAEHVRAAILGQALSVLLMQRGTFPLHASAVLVGDEAIALAGSSGAGKSTLATALSRRGRTFLCDDVAAVDVDGDACSIPPGIPRIKLEDEVFDWLGESTDGLQRLLAKHLRPVPEFSGEGSYRLRRVYTIHDGPEIGFEPLSVREGFLEIARSFHRPEVAVRAIGQVALMQQSARLAERISVVRLTRPRAMDTLEQVVERLDEHIGELAADPGGS